ncbi:SDR family NAD(P)-dependent oxidoreductase, partial [Mycobacterium sp.]|uniref:SDR family NAD(P)-dependent oxidoreductase n=1 Tax=Mycobacterium sp. TaxID=1785 RepID=UPI001286F10E
MGMAAALLFAAEGARVVGCDLNSDRAEATLSAVLKAGGSLVSRQPCDLTVRSNCDAVIDLALETYGGIDVVYNNAAMAYFGWVDQIPFEDFARTLNEEVNIVFHMVQASWPHLVKRGGGSIINTASAAGKIGIAKLPQIAHSSAKGAIIAMTRQLAVEGGPHQIRANTISPGIVETNQTIPLLQDPQWHEAMVEQTVLRRIGQPQDIASAALFLAWDESSWITGSDLAVDG